jgi:hypothetical protein
MNLYDGWPQARLIKRSDMLINTNIGRWFHSDAKDVAYRYNYPMWNKYVEIGDLK